ncbi:MAG: serine hydrolase domain-containing protein, partial [Planctomycetota bacterium]
MQKRSRRDLSIRRAVSVIFCFLLVPLFSGVYAQTRLAKPSGDPEIEAIITEFRASIPKMMQDEDVPGLSIAMIDNDGIIWTQGFGYTDKHKKTPVTPETIFSIQSTSKTFTATAVIFAVQDGLVELDAPINTYIPNFKVKSRFEEKPEEKITLRHLLSHTAGFAMSAPIGNVFDPTLSSFEEHIKSISDTWMRYPVGQRYSYSNLGVDLAGYILQVVSGKSFGQYMKEKLFDVIGMTNSSVDMKVIKANKNRAIGHSNGFEEARLAIPMIPAGGVYTSATESAKFVQFHLNKGK